MKGIIKNVIIVFTYYTDSNEETTYLFRTTNKQMLKHILEKSEDKELKDISFALASEKYADDVSLYLLLENTKMIPLNQPKYKTRRFISYNNARRLLKRAYSKNSTTLEKIISENNISRIIHDKRNIHYIEAQKLAKKIQESLENKNK
ncbi:hypothetical protein LJB88_05470 [Erysipelotrichaceae bacterium OttesenSCG-928-M19]|nr:hypothetical protein [Erysipelotrichaceae bacterium OttesenSCG-928-M19]